MIRTLRATLIRLSGFVRSSRRERELAQELESHLQLHIDDNLRAGMTHEEARRRALIRLGGIEQTKERYRDRASLPWLEMAVQDLRGGLRSMRRTPGFTAVALLTLALGIGANTVMFSVVNTLLLRPLPYHDPERLVSMHSLGENGRRLVTAPPDFYVFRERAGTVDFLDAYYSSSFNLTGLLEPERLPGLVVSSGFFGSLGVPPALGRGFVVGDEQWGSHRVALLTDGLWQRRFGANPTIVGDRIMLNAQPYTVVGVLPPSFSFLGRDLQVFVPMAFEPGDNMNTHNNHFLSMFARLKSGVPIETASADLNRIAADIRREQPLSTSPVVGVYPLQELLVRDIRRSVLVLLGAVTFVLLICCANLANLLLARGAVREREIAVRTAIGASRSRILRQLLTESLVLALTGGLAGLVIAYVSIDGLNLLSQRILPRAEAIRIDTAVLAFTFGVTALTGILFGLAPAVKNSAANLNDGLKDGSRTASSGHASHRLRAALVVAEVALSLMLLIAAGLMVKGMYRLLNVDAGFNAERVLTLQISLPAQKYIDEQRARTFAPDAYARTTAFFTGTVDRIRALAGVHSVGAVNGLPLMGEIWGKNLTLLDRPLPKDLSGTLPYQYRVVVGDYFRAMGIRVFNGRAFADTDTRQSAPVVVVNREAVRRYWNGEEPIGKVVSLNPPLEILPEDLIRQARLAGLPEDYRPPKYTVVGVVDDVRGSGLSNPVLPTVYAPFSQGSEGATSLFVTVRAASDPLALVGAIRDEIRQIDPNQAVASIQTMEARLAASVAQRRTEMTVLTVFAAMALFLAAIGIYGVMSYWVTQRKKEIGIRMALGAERRQVMRLVLRQSVVMLASGLSLGIVGALMATRVLDSLLFEVSATDPAVFTIFALTLAASSWVAAYVPARRATRFEPVVTLRHE